MLEEKIRKQLSAKKILLMTHLVLGYPSFKENFKAIEAMSKAGVVLVEMQIPFSEPTADGPVISRANYLSLKNGTKVVDCFCFAQETCKLFPQISFLFMTYYNIIFNYGEKNFASKAKELGIKGFIIPDLPPEEAGGWLSECKKQEMANIFIFTPTHTVKRLGEISEMAGGFVYCVGRRGVTGEKTKFDATVLKQIETYRKATNLPLALGFGIQEKSDIMFLTGKIDIAVIGSHLLKIQETKGTEGIESFLNNLGSD